MTTKAAFIVLRIAALVLAPIALASCGSTVTTVHRTTSLRSTARWVMLPIANYSEAPQAGERIEALLETLLRRGGIESIEHYPALKEDDTHLVMSDRQRFEESLAWAKAQHFDYAVSGSVEEWRYKSGLDGEPAVGVSVRIVELGTGRVLWAASGTKTGGGGDNASGTALKLLDALVGELSLTR